MRCYRPIADKQCLDSLLPNRQLPKAARALNSFAPYPALKLLSFRHWRVSSSAVKVHVYSRSVSRRVDEHPQASDAAIDDFSRVKALNHRGHTRFA